MLQQIQKGLLLPVGDFAQAVQATAGAGMTGLLVAGAGYAVSWWIYVPLHELLHALGCWATGGAVTRLEIDGIYGAALLARVFPFVTVGSAYAGQLTGFDTRGSDLVYLATDAAPFVLTVVVGVPLLRRVSTVGDRTRGESHRPSLARSALFGAALPIAFAPFLSLTGDYYEMGSILVSRAAALVHPALDVKRWRSDDLFKLSAALFPSPSNLHVGDVLGVLAASLIGLSLSVATYGLGSWLAARSLGRSRAGPSQAQAPC
jgi:hypothetical protein